MAKPNVALNLPQRYSKGLVVLFGCQVVPFYKLDEVASEGAPVQFKAGATDDEVELVTPGSAPSGKVIGLAAQQVYDAEALGELRFYEKHNNTQARKGDTIGVVTGQGWVMTNNYVGSVTKDDKLYPAASGKLSASQTGSDVHIGVAEGSGTDGDTLIRVRVDFKIAE